MKNLFILLIMLISLNGFAEVKMQDYGFSMQVKPFKDNTAIYRVDMPNLIYQNIYYDNLRDLQVFDASGHVISSAIIKASREVKNIKNSAFFPIYNFTESGPVIQFKVHKIKDGFVAKTKSSDDSQQAYLVVPKVKPNFRLVGFTVRWPTSKENIFLKATIYGSNDLNHWQLLSNHVFASLNYQGNRISKNYVPLYRSYEYYMLTWKKPDKVVAIKSVTTRYLGHNQVHERTLFLSDSGYDEEQQGYRYYINGKYPITAINLYFEKIGQVIKAQIYAKATLKDSWQQQIKLFAYRILYDSKLFTNDKQYIKTPLSFQYWLVKMPKVSDPPKLSVYWLAQPLLFLDNNNGPYTVAFGLRNAPKARRELQLLLDDKHKVITVPKYINASLDNLQTLSGKAALNAKSVKDIHQIILSIVILLGLIFAIWMVYSLLKQLRTQT